MMAMAIGWTALATPPARSAELPFEDPLFRRCVTWLLEGQGGAMIENLCIDRFAMPSPSLFQCARKVMTGFTSDNDQAVCAVIFDEQARRTRAARVAR